MNDTYKISRDKMIELLNEDLAREYQAIIAYTVYSQTMKGAAYNKIAAELELHAAEELNHALLITKQIKSRTICRTWPTRWGSTRRRSSRPYRIYRRKSGLVAHSAWRRRQAG
jgi:rubrerythrin